MSIRYSERLAETINGLYKAELIHRRAPWKSREAVELATLEWVDWFNTQRLHSAIGYRLRWKKAITINSATLPNKLFYYNQTASAKPGRFSVEGLHVMGTRRARLKVNAPESFWTIFALSN